jgi:alpha-D-ribose 1-methylphosphonate 5-triphosphate synthase subunit PhnG
MNPHERATALSVLCQAPGADVATFAEALLPELAPISVLRHQTGLVMLPMEESAQGASFYLGEVLVCEAHVRLAEHEGYALCLGRDMRHALAAAILDAAMAAGLAAPHIAAFVATQALAQAEADAALVRQVEATRVEMETF